MYETNSQHLTGNNHRRSSALVGVLIFVSPTAAKHKATEVKVNKIGNG